MSDSEWVCVCLFMRYEVFFCNCVKGNQRDMVCDKKIGAKYSALPYIRKSLYWYSCWKIMRWYQFVRFVFCATKSLFPTHSIFPAIFSDPAPPSSGNRKKNCVNSFAALFFFLNFFLLLYFYFFYVVVAVLMLFLYTSSGLKWSVRNRYVVELLVFPLSLDGRVIDIVYSAKEKHSKIER